MGRRMAALAALALAACTQPAPAPTPPSPPQPVAIDAPAGAYQLDAAHTTVLVRANHFGLATYTLRMTGVSGTLTFDPQNPTRSSVTATVAADSVQTGYPGQRSFDDELANSDWLDAADHPTATFTSRSVELTGPNTGRVTGDLSMRGVSRPFTLDVTFNRAYRQHPMGLHMALLGFSARGVFKRSDYGMTVLLPASPEGVGVSDDVTLEIDAEFAQPGPEANPVQ